MAKIIVIGSNHAGNAAITTILSHYPENQVTMYERNDNISFLGCGTALWLGGQIDGYEGLFYTNPDTLKAQGAKINVKTDVTHIDFENKIVYYKNAEGEGQDSYDKLILATGSLPIQPKINGLDKDGVHLVKLFQNALEIDKELANPDIHHVTVVGAGYIGVEVAEAFKRRGKEVSLVDNMDHCLSTYYDEEFTTLMEDNLKKHGVDLHFGETLVEVLGDKRVNGVRTTKGEFKTDMLILCIGFRPNSELGKNHLELFKNGAYLVDKHQQTSDKDVYAIGDCATVYDNALQDTSYIALATNAVRTGIIAAHNVCGTDLEGIGVQGSNGINIWDLKMISTGLNEARAKKLGFEVKSTTWEDLQRPAFMRENDKVKIKIVYDAKTRRVLGMQCASNYDMSMLNHMFSLAIQEKITIDKLSLLDIFFLPHFNQPYNYITMAALTAK
ncbi:MAG: FAD-dependent oxidoreductase [Eubacteriales bacterium]|nr:FAD-dependent oxidoreductase [Eubacteriales bacterium]